MGRYYQTNNHEGKFGFAVQDSNDPEIFGMTEDQSVIHYYMSSDKKDKVKKVLDEQYDILGIDKKDRVYVYDESKIDKVMDAAYNKNWHTYDKDKDEGCATLFDGKAVYPNNKDVELAVYRVLLGTKIMYDLENDGYCSLEAEC